MKAYARRQLISRLFATLGGVAVSSRLSAAYPARVSSIAQLARLTTKGLPDLFEVYVEGFAAANDGGGGVFIWHATENADIIRGFVVQPLAGGNGRWHRRIGDEIDDRMAGARVDGTSYDDEALVALATCVGRFPVRKVRFVPGARKILHPDFAHTPFQLVGVNDLILKMEKCDFLVGRSQEVGSSNIFAFYNCQRVSVLGTPRFLGNLTAGFMQGTGTATGTVGMQFVDNCSGARFSVQAFGIQCPFLFSRRPRLSVDPETPAIVVAGGRGYVVGDTLQLSGIGSIAERPALWKVEAVNRGAVARLKLVDGGLFGFNNAANGLRNDARGFPLSGGKGVGCQILPYMRDHDIASMSAGIFANALARNCFYGGQFQFSGVDSTVSLDCDFVFRSFVYYGGPRRNRVFIRQRNVRGDAFASGSSMGLGSDVDLHLVQLPTSSTTFANNCSLARWDYASGMPAKCAARITYDVKVGAGGNIFGSVFEIEKRGLNDADITFARGHFGEFDIGGSITGLGRQDSGAGLNWGGTNVSIPMRAWAGENLSISLRDGLVCKGRGAWIFAATALRRLSIGKIRSDGPVATEFEGAALQRQIIGPVQVDREAIFSNSAFKSASGSAGTIR